MGTCSAMARIGSLITPFVSQVQKKLSTLTSVVWCTNLAFLIFSHPVLVLGDAQGVGVFDSIDILLLLSAGRDHLSNASHWNDGQASAGVQHWSGWNWGVEQHSRPPQWIVCLLGTRAGSNCRNYISESVRLRGEGQVLDCGKHGDWRTTKDNLITRIGL